MGLAESVKVAKEGAEVAKGARELYEKRTKKSALSPLNAKKYLETNNEGESNE